MFNEGNNEKEKKHPYVSTSCEQTHMLRNFEKRMKFDLTRIFCNPS